MEIALRLTFIPIFNESTRGLDLSGILAIHFDKNYHRRNLHIPYIIPLLKFIVCIIKKKEFLKKTSEGKKS